MGLRERKAERTRERIVREALALFKGGGYEQTTMEAIAEAAEISPSTLYRYFPTKDGIILDQFRSFSEELSRAFVRYSADRPVEEALAEAIFAALHRQDEHPEETLLVRSIIDNAPIPRARLWDYLEDQLQDMGRCLAKKLHLPNDDLRIVLTARLVAMIVGTAADIWRASGGRRSARSCAKKVMRLLEDRAVIFPRSRTGP